jgi:hypothetical protein
MSLYDVFSPMPSVVCPICGDSILIWQGDGLLGLFHWAQGKSAPILQESTDEYAYTEQELSSFRLDEDQEIQGYGCACQDSFLLALALVRDGVWIETCLYAAVSRSNKYAKPHLLWPENRSWKGGTLEDTQALIAMSRIRDGEL